MKNTLGIKTSCLATVALLRWGAGAEAVTVPYNDTFSVPPYVNNATIIGQQGWQKFSGADGSMVITNDPTGSGRGTLLSLTNAAGGGYWLYQTIDQAFATNDLRIQFDIYGTKPDPDSVVMPTVVIRDSQGFTSEAAFLQAMGANTSSGSVFRLNNSSSLIVPDIAAQGGKWYTVTFDFAFNPKRYNVEITDGVSTGRLDNVPFWSTANGVGWITFRPNSGSGFGNGFEGGLVDNLVVVPEPSAALLAGLGGLALWRRRIASCVIRTS